MYKKICSFLNFLLLFFLLLDPTNEIFHMKNLAYFLFIIFNLPRMKGDRVIYVIVCLAIYFFSYSLGLLMNSNIDVNRSINLLKSFMFLTYICFVDIESIKSFKYFYYLALMIGIIEIVLYIIVGYTGALGNVIYTYLKIHNHFIMINTHRVFLGIPFISVYFRTSSVCTIALALSLYNLFKTKQKKFFIHSIILFCGLFCSGTRANILSGGVLVLISYLLYIYLYKKNLVRFSFLIILSMFFIFSLIIKLLTDNDPGSLGVKQLHIYSYNKLFDSNPVKYLLVGGGPGEIFFSHGINRFTSYTEITYFDLIKDFGLINFSIFIGMFLIPIYFLIKNNEYDKFYKRIISFGYISYLFISATNPLLISSTGFTVFSIMFGLSKRKEVKNKNE